MCVVSNVFDHYGTKFYPYVAPPSTTPTVTFPPAGITTAEVAELRKLIAEFREAVAAARTVDKLTDQPDCEDPKKATLEERVAALEEALASR